MEPGNEEKAKPRLLGRFLVLVCFLLIGASIFAIVSLGARSPSALVYKKTPPEASSSHATTDANTAVAPNRSAFGQFPPRTNAERDLENMLRGKDEGIDLALANWLIAADVPEFQGTTRDMYFAELDRMTGQVRRDIARMEKVAISRGKNPADPDTRCAMFCNAIVNLRFAYTEEFRSEKLTPAQMRGLYSDANNIFLAGLLRTRRGSCVSMPLPYLVIGRRLGMPVHLVSVGQHCFIRWEEPGYRLNIETTRTDKVWVTDDDNAFLEIEGIAPNQVKGSQLRNLTDREVLGELFFARSGYWELRERYTQTRRCLDLSRARQLAPDDPGIEVLHAAVFSHYGIKPEHQSIEIRVARKN